MSENEKQSEQQQQPEQLLAAGSEQWNSGQRRTRAIRYGVPGTPRGTRLGRDLAGLSQAVNRLRKRAEANPRLAAELEELKEQLGQIPKCQA